MYTIEQLSRISGLTTRTLRNYLKSGILEGRKDAGVWKFTEQQVSQFLQHPTVQPSIDAKRHAIVYDFLAGQNTEKNEICILLDRALDEQDAGEIANYFCKTAENLSHFRFSYAYASGKAHFILKGAESDIHRLMKDFYQNF